MNVSDEVRHLSLDEAKSLRAGSGHYRAFVGPPAQYDFMGATQFRLLCTLGLRDDHTVLDYGCGSLRAGRLLIPYLRPQRYFGLEPNRWLIEDAISREIGQDLVRIKQPTFRHDDDFLADHFGTSFDFIVAQSIFSHAGRDVIGKALSSLRRVLKPRGLALVTFIRVNQIRIAQEYDGSGWCYPHSVAYRLETIDNLIAQSGLSGRALPWFHPRQTWFALAHEPDGLPPPEQDRHLSGAVLRDPEFVESANVGHRKADTDLRSRPDADFSLGL